MDYYELDGKNNTVSNDKSWYDRVIYEYKL